MAHTVSDEDADRLHFLNRRRQAIRPGGRIVEPRWRRWIAPRAGTTKSPRAMGYYLALFVPRFWHHYAQPASFRARWCTGPEIL